MARISAKRNAGGYCVTIAGRLSASDLRRLERACGPALERHPLALALNVCDMTGTDSAAEAFIGRLVDRGAQLHHSRTARHQANR